MTKSDLQIRRAQLKVELSSLLWRKDRLDQRCDVLIKEIDAMTIEMSAIEILEVMATEQQKSLPTYIEMVG